MCVMLLTADRYGSDEAAKAKAEELLEEWKNGDATEESFAELAGAWLEDGGSSLNGGLYGRWKNSMIGALIPPGKLATRIL